MMTAREAREIANNINDQSVSDKLKSILNDVTERCNSGYTFITYKNKNLSNRIIVVLQELGYNIRYRQTYNDEYTSIEWK